MPLPPNFYSRLAAMPDAELLTMIGHGSDYLPEALAAAQAEMRRREIDPQVAQQVESALNEEAAVAQERAARPLPMFWRVVCVLLPFGFIQSMVADRYLNKGYLRCYHEFVLWKQRRIVFWGITFATILILNFLWPLGDREWIGWIIEVIALIAVLRMPLPRIEHVSIQPSTPSGAASGRENMEKSEDRVAAP